MDGLTHIDRKGNARMVDISGKPLSKRAAQAKAKIYLQKQTLDLITENSIAKGDVIATARIAAIAAAKRTSDLIPLSHNITLSHVQVDFVFCKDGIEIITRTTCTAKTGVELEALTAASVGALTIYDMCKAVDKQMKVGDIRLIKKTKKKLLTRPAVNKAEI